MSKRLLDVSDLSVTLKRAGKPITPVDGVSFTVDRGEAVGIAGESGCGKSLTLKSIIGLLPPGAVTGGQLKFTLHRDEPVPYEPADVQGHGISMISQEPMTALNPTMRVGDLIAEGFKVHAGLDRSTARERTVELMRMVGIPTPERRARMWPHQLSGGLRQRVMIATALSTEPKLILCDEPTTALDVSIQDQILGLLQDIRTRLEMSIIFVSHDLAVIGELCDRIVIMYAGQVVETGPVEELFADPKHPYTEALMHSVPSFDATTDELEGIEGSPPDPGSFSEGCRFAPRCDYARDDCRTAPFELISIGAGRETACIHPELIGGGQG
jgi:oligopeptide/dipeptide ABC transporter ATP-binding protein